jgi:hypothetical protein
MRKIPTSVPPLPLPTPPGTVPRVVVLEACRLVNGRDRLAQALHVAGSTVARWLAPDNATAKVEGLPLAIFQRIRQKQERGETMTPLPDPQEYLGQELLVRLLLLLLPTDRFHKVLNGVVFQDSRTDTQIDITGGRPKAIPTMAAATTPADVKLAKRGLRNLVRGLSGIASASTRRPRSASTRRRPTTQDPKRRSKGRTARR